MPEYIQGAELDDMPVTWTDDDGTLYDYSTGYTFTLKIGRPGEAAVFTKTSGMTGAATAPNLNVVWATTGELNSLEPGTYTLQIAARRTLDDRDRFMQDSITIVEAVV